VRGENVITGFRHADLSQQLPAASTHQVSRYIKRLRVQGSIKRIGPRCKYDITELGRRAVLTGLKPRELFVTPLTQRTAVSDLIADPDT
jgi:predicted transcriptional regulator